MKVVIIFSEGPHDVAYIKLVLELYCNIKHEENAIISKFPKPLNNIFTKLMNEHAMSDLSLDEVHKFLLPSYVFKMDTHFIMLFNTGGKENCLYIKNLLSKIIQVIINFDESYDFNIKDLKYLFTYDVDNLSEQERIDEIKSKIFPITENDAYPDEVDTIEASPKTLLDAAEDSVNFYIWTNKGSAGTLEDILLPIYRINNNAILEKSKAFINDNFPHEFEYTDEITEHNISKKADESKACITIAGQGKKPSKPLTAIITDNVLADSDSFKSDKEVKKFGKFLQEKFGF